MELEILEKANKLQGEIADLERHIQTLSGVNNKIKNGDPGGYKYRWNWEPVGVNYVRGDYHDTVRLNQEFINVQETVDLYLMRANIKLERMKAELAAL